MNSFYHWYNYVSCASKDGEQTSVMWFSYKQLWNCGNFTYTKVLTQYCYASVHLRIYYMCHIRVNVLVTTVSCCFVMFSFCLFTLLVS